MKQTSMIDVAYELVKEGDKAYSFKELYDAVALSLEFDEGMKMKNIGEFYTELTVDGRFYGLGGNVWDLRERHNHTKTRDAALEEAYAEAADDSGADEEDKQEEKEYNAEIEGKSLADETEEESSGDEDDEGEHDKYTDEEVSTLIGK
jgi:DNA-directed RNA polymerase subunit delta